MRQPESESCQSGPIERTKEVIVMADDFSL
jgi:hypothetical protein